MINYFTSPTHTHVDYIILFVHGTNTTIRSILQQGKVGYWLVQSDRSFGLGHVRYQAHRLRANIITIPLGMGVWKLYASVMVRQHLVVGLPSVPQNVSLTFEQLSPPDFPRFLEQNRKSAKKKQKNISEIKKNNRGYKRAINAYVAFLF